MENIIVFDKKLLIKLLQERKVSMVKVANESGLSHGTLSRLRSGKNQGLHADILYKIAKYFNRPMEDFLIEEPYIIKNL